MTYAMNAHGKTAYFAMYTRDLLQTYTINDDQFSGNTVLKLANGQVYYNEEETVYLNGMDADTCILFLFDTSVKNFLYAFVENDYFFKQAKKY